MNAVMQWIATMWSYYWGDGFYQYLFLAAALYLLIFRRKEKSTRQMLLYSLAVLFLFLCPLTAVIIRACIGDSVYWRILWLLPTAPVIALAATQFLKARRSRLAKALLLLVFTGIIAVSGEDMFRSGNYYLAANYQKVPNEVAHICDVVNAEAEKDGIEQITLAGDETVASYVRVYDASIFMPYGRRKKGALTKASNTLYQAINAEKPKYKRIAKYAKKAGCNFVVAAVPEKRIKRFQEYGFYEIGRAGSYVIFQLEENSMS